MAHAIMKLMNLETMRVDTEREGARNTAASMN